MNTLFLHESGVLMSMFALVDNTISHQANYEWVVCALCGEDDTSLLYEINLDTRQLSDLWLDGKKLRLNKTEKLVVCDHCGLAYMNPRVRLSEGVSLYTVEQELAYFEATRQKRTHAFERLVQQLPVWLGHTPTTMLDFGCGDALLVEVARKNDIFAVGAEISPDLIKSGNARLGDGAILDFRGKTSLDSSFDVITAINVIEHLPYPKAVLEMLARALNPGGILLVHVPNFGGWPARIAGKSWRQIEPLGHFYYFTEKTLKALFREVACELLAGF